MAAILSRPQCVKDLMTPFFKVDSPHLYSEKQNAILYNQNQTLWIKDQKLGIRFTNVVFELIIQILKKKFLLSEQ